MTGQVMTNAALRGKPDAGNPHVRFDEGEAAPATTPRRGSLLYIKMKRCVSLLAFAAVFAAQADFEVWFLRHGETTWNRAKILQGSISYTGLTPKGVAMAEATGDGMWREGIRFDRVYTSPYARTRATADIVSAKTGPKPIDEVRIREMCFGSYEGRKYGKDSCPDENIRNFFFGDAEKYVPKGDGAETFAQVQARLRDFLKNELRPLDGKVARVLCVAHSLVLRSLVRELAGEGASAAAKNPLQRNCCVHTVKFSNGEFRLADTGRIFYDPELFDSVPKTRLVAHRGAADLTMPEASLPAYSNAVIGASDIVKLDLQSTRDGVIVMGHDPTLKRGMDWDVRIRDLDYGEILGKGRYVWDGKRTDLGVVRLDQALAIVKAVPEFWVDFKYYSPEFAEAAMAEFDKAKIDRSRIMIATFTRPALEYFRDRHPEIRRVGHVHFRRMESGELAASFGGKFDSVENALPALCDYADRLRLFGVNVPTRHGLCTGQGFISGLRRHGLWVSLWFVQTGELAADLQGLDADAYVTDFAAKVRQSVK